MNKKSGKKETSEQNTFLLIILILLFIFTLYISVRYISRYNDNGKIGKNEEIVKINRQEYLTTIINNGYVEEDITEDFFSEDEIIVENINKIKLSPNNSNGGEVFYNVKYYIEENSFDNPKEVLVKFAYSTNKKDWKYINNVISTVTSNISPLIGNVYDISDLNGNLYVQSNVKLDTKNREEKIIYWKSETIFKKNKNSTKENKFVANFTINYKGIK